MVGSCDLQSREQLVQTFNQIFQNHEGVHGMLVATNTGFLLTDANMGLV